MLLGYLNKRIGSDVYSYQCFKLENKIIAVKVEKRGDMIVRISPFFEIKKVRNKYGFWEPKYCFMTKELNIENSVKYKDGDIIKNIDYLNYKFGAKIIYIDKIYFATLDERGNYKKKFVNLGDHFDKECLYYWDPSF